MVSRRNGSVSNSTRDSRRLRRMVEESGRSPVVALNFKSMRSGMFNLPGLSALKLRDSRCRIPVKEK